MLVTIGYVCRSTGLMLTDKVVHISTTVLALTKPLHQCVRIVMVITRIIVAC